MFVLEPVLDCTRLSCDDYVRDDAAAAAPCAPRAPRAPCLLFQPPLSTPPPSAAKAHFELRACSALGCGSHPGGGPGWF